MIPTSAISLSSRVSGISLPGSPGSNWRGVWLVALRKRQLPRPPRPPAATTTVWAMVVRSARISPEAVKRTMVPQGTRSSSGLPALPLHLRPAPGAPFSAYQRLRRA